MAESCYGYNAKDDERTNYRSSIGGVNHNEDGPGEQGFMQLLQQGNRMRPSPVQVSPRVQDLCSYKPWSYKMQDGERRTISSQANSIQGEEDVTGVNLQFEGKSGAVEVLVGRSPGIRSDGGYHRERFEDHHGCIGKLSSGELRVGEDVRSTAYGNTTEGLGVGPISG